MSEKVDLRGKFIVVEPPSWCRNTYEEARESVLETFEMNPDRVRTYVIAEVTSVFRATLSVEESK